MKAASNFARSLVKTILRSGIGLYLNKGVILLPVSSVINSLAGTERVHPPAFAIARSVEWTVRSARTSI